MKEEGESAKITCRGLGAERREGQRQTDTDKRRREMVQKENGEKKRRDKERPDQTRRGKERQTDRPIDR